MFSGLNKLDHLFLEFLKILLPFCPPPVMSKKNQSVFKMFEFFSPARIYTFLIISSRPLTTNGNITPEDSKNTSIGGVLDLQRGER